MNIGLDLDDTLAAFQIKWLEYHNSNYGTNVTYDESISYDFSKILKIPLDVAISRVFDFYKTKSFREITPIEGAVEVVNGWNSHKLFIITSRPDSTKRVSSSWIKKYFPNRFSELVFTNQFKLDPSIKSVTKVEVANRLKLDLMFEDALHHAKDISDSGIPVILLDKPWNQSDEKFDKITRIKSWGEVDSMI